MTPGTFQIQQEDSEQKPAAEQKAPEVKKSHHVIHKITMRNKGHELAKSLADQFALGRLLARVSSRPGQCGRCDGYILEGPELEFYQKKLSKKKSTKA